jgi:hypothetical protein
MAKFDYKKAILENKATFHSSLNEDKGLTPFQQEIFEEEISEEAELPALELDQVQNIAQQVADEFTKYETELDLKFSISPDSVEASPKGAGFDLDITAGPNTPGDEWKDEKGFGIENYLGKFAGGSYLIKSEGDKHKIYNAATGNSYIGYVTPQGEVVFEYEKSMNEAEEAPKSNKMKKSELKELIKSSIMNEIALDIDNMEDAPESEVDFLAEIEAILAEADKVKEGVWSVVPARIPEFIKAIEDIKEEYHGIVGSDDVYNGLDAAISAAEELLMNTAEINEADEEVAVDDTEVAVDGEENIDVDTTTEVDPNVKAVQDALTQAQAAAQKLGDPKLTDQIGNTITFFTRAHVVDKGAVAEGQEEMSVDAAADKVENAVDDKLKATVNALDDKQKEQLRAGLAKLGITANTDPETIASKIDESLFEAEGDTKTKIANALSDIGGGLMKSLLVPIIPVAIGSMGPGVAAGLAITAGTAGILIALAKALGAEKSMEEGKKEYYDAAESDDAAHINALEKDMEDDKDSSMKIKEVVFPMWQRIK